MCPTCHEEFRSIQPPLRENATNGTVNVTNIAPLLNKTPQFYEEYDASKFIKQLPTKTLQPDKMVINSKKVDCLLGKPPKTFEASDLSNFSSLRLPAVSESKELQEVSRLFRNTELNASRKCQSPILNSNLSLARNSTKEKLDSNALEISLDSSPDLYAPILSLTGRSELSTTAWQDFKDTYLSKSSNQGNSYT
jgi:hypothetical protein